MALVLAFASGSIITWILLERTRASERLSSTEDWDRLYDENRRLVRLVVAMANPTAVRYADPVAEERVSLDELAGDEETRTTLHEMFG
jgi:hypothetical protein